MNIPKRHHYVPQMLLRRFCDENGKLWLFNKKAPQLGVTFASPEAAFFQKHFYSLNENGVRDVSLEKYFSELEVNPKWLLQSFVIRRVAGMSLSLQL